MGRIRRGGYIFEFWVGDHPPRHVHVLKDRRLVARVALDKSLSLIEGKLNRQVKEILKSLLIEGIFKK